MAEKKRTTRASSRRKKVVDEIDMTDSPVMEAPVLEKQFNPLTDRRIYVKPIKRSDSWLPPSHEANFLYKEAYFEICAPTDDVTGNIVQPLTEDEVMFFEDRSLSYVHGLNYNEGDLSPARGEGNVWWTHTGEYVLKLKNEVKVLDLRKAKHYILYKMLLANSELIAPDGESGTPGNIGHKATFKFKLEEEGFEARKQASYADKLKDAWILFGKFEDDRDAMVTLLSLAHPTKRYKYESKMEDFKSELKDLIDSRIDKFLEIAQDELFKMKVFLYKSIRFGFVIKERHSIYTEGGDHVLGRNMTEAAEFLSYPENQGIYIEITEKIRATE